MPRIRVLPDILANKIAAGEIVERPASVVKELVENALDAGGQSIEIEVLAGGKQRIAVRDDGIGMSRDDALLAFKHHATSKISELSDLDHLDTLGFRGEALPSIASVSRLTLKTVECLVGLPPSAGTELRIEGGVQQSVREIAWPRGTEIIVEDLFFNVPARKKFLKTVTTELGHITRQITHYGLAYPERHFRFTQGTQATFDLAPAGSLRERIFQIFGERFLDNLVEVDTRVGSLRVFGFVSLPHEQRGTRNTQYYFVNQRVVRDRILAQAAQQFYRPLLPQGVFPVVLLFLEIPPEEVDVNVHPSKIEVRFRDSSSVFLLIRAGLDRAISSGQPVETGSVGPAALFRAPESTQRAHGEPWQYHAMLAGPDRRQEALRYPSLSPTPSEAATVSMLHGSIAIESAEEISQPRPLGQFLESFIVAADRQQIFIVDQHVAHERVLYESVLEELQSGHVTRQQLLIPETVELSLEQKALLPELLPELERNGFEVEPFGGNTIVVKAVPASAGQVDLNVLLRDIVDAVGGEGDAPSLEQIQDRVAASIACRAAIKVNTPLALEKMQWLLDALFKTKNPTTCPHGRPIILRMGTYDVLKSFKRI